MCLGMFMAILDVQIVATSIPTIQSALGVAPDQMSWVQMAYLIAEVVAIPLTGFLSRALGMRWLFISAVSLFTLASVGCAASNSFPALITWRVVQGFSGGTLIPAVFSAVFLLFPHRQKGGGHDHRRCVGGAGPDRRPLRRRRDHRNLFLTLVVPDQHRAMHRRCADRRALFAPEIRVVADGAPA
jgi:MFS family permease